VTGFRHISGGLESFKSNLPAAVRARFEAAESRMAERVAGGLPAIPDDRPTPCSHCHGSGLVYAQSWIPGEDPTPELVTCTRCPMGMAVEQRQHANLIGGSGLEDFGDVTFGSFRPTAAQASQYDAVQTFGGCPRGWMWLYGVYHSGKTSMAKMLGNYWLGARKPVLYRVEPVLMIELRSTFDAGSEQTFTRQLSELLHSPLLILDDFGKAKSSAWVEEQRFTICQHRLEHRLPTVVTTNLDFDDMDTMMPRLTPRIFDDGNCQLVGFSEPYRADRQHAAVSRLSE